MNFKTVKVDGDAAIKILEGNWWKFPPPAPGIYDVRQPGSVLRSYRLYERIRVTEHPNGKGALLCLGLTCHTEGKLKGLEFRFPIGYSVGAWPTQSVFVPYEVGYRWIKDGSGTYVETRFKDRVTVLPIARCVEEARYVVSRMQELWPEFTGRVIEYQEEST